MGSKCLFVTRVRGLSRLPVPPASTIPFIRPSILSGKSPDLPGPAIFSCGVRWYIVVKKQFPAGGAEQAIMGDSQPLQPALQRCPQDSKSIFHASSEIDRGRLVEVFCRTRDFADAETKANALSEHFIVENKVIRIFEQ